MIKLLKIITGEEIIAEVTELLDNKISLKSPISIGMAPNGVAMMEFCPFIKEKQIVLDKKHIIFDGTPDVEILNAYNSRFGSGIVVGSQAHLNLFTPDEWNLY